MTVWLFLKGLSGTLMRVSVPLLVAGIALMSVSSGLIWKWGVADQGRRKAEARASKLDVALRSVSADLAACHVSVDRLTVSLEAQNAAVEALRAESDLRTRRANAALRRADEQARGLRARIVTLEKSKPTADLCESARSLIIDTLREERS